MAETLNLGTDGNWATKEDSLLAYNSENGNFKPLPFDFTRASSATVVNKDGLIETVGSGEPRIDYKDNSKGALLLEPSRSNLVTYSEDFSNAYWTKINTNTSNSVISPDSGLNGTKYTLDATSSRSQISRSIFNIGTLYTTSVFVKYDSVKYFYISNAGADAYRVVFDIENGIIVSNGASITSSKIENYGNGWYRCSSVFTAAYSTLYLKFSPNSNGTTFTNTTDFSYIYGAQLEQGSYPTSYIPTQGGVVTRVAESSEQTPPSGIIGQTEGSVYVEGTAILDTNGSMPFTIYLNSSNILYCWFRTNGIIDIDVFANGLFQDRIRTSVGTIANGDYFKLSVGYKSNDLVAYLNGVQIGTASPSSIPSCSSLILGGYIAADYTGSLIKETKLYNTRLTNAELQALTTI